VDLREDLKNNLREYRRRACEFVERMAIEISHDCFKIVAFTSCFQQQCASLALARTLKLKNPNLKIIFGGANCEGEMGRATYENYKYVDAVVSGEAENVAVPLCKYLLRECATLPKIAGVLLRDSLRKPDQTKRRAAGPVVTDTFAPPFQNMDASPVPEFSGFVAAFADVILPDPPRLLFETSRGCWWGEKHHCTFCGLNGHTMAFRSKSPALAVAQLEELARQYPGYSISMTDNIVDSAYFRTFFRDLSSRDLSVDLFYEMKANVRKDQLELVRRCGITMIQPGIESLSTAILRLMKKGTTALQNLQLLRWCRELGIAAEWNFLWGFPGEDPEEYRKMATLIGAVTHLKPPGGVGRLRLDRFSPYFRDATRQFKRHFPAPAYRLVYPFGEEELQNIAYFFDFEYKDGQEPSEYTARLRDEIMSWKEEAGRSVCCYYDVADKIYVLDTRQRYRREGGSVLHVLSGQARAILLHGDRVRNLRAACETIGSGMDPASLNECVAGLVQAGLIVIDGEDYLALPIAGSEFYPGAEVLEGIWGARRQDVDDALVG
jgi:ribosomal peptide maturation radical SAM protein 1